MPPTDIAVARWVETSFWPAFDEREQRQRRLDQDGVSSMRPSSAAELQQASKELCEDLLKGTQKPRQSPCYPIERTDDVLERVYILNEARILRDVTPWIVPSPENLRFSGELELDYIGEEVQADWQLVASLGGGSSSGPQPDLTVGLQRHTFTADELTKIAHYHTSDKPMSFTPDLCFPFLTCEVRIRLVDADKQNLHNGSLAVRAIVELYAAAYGLYHPKTADLFGRILAFSVSHNDCEVTLYGHYAMLKENGIQYARHFIDKFSFCFQGGRQRYCAYNFVRNVYDQFAPCHRGRIQDALGQLEMPQSYHSASLSSSELMMADDEELPQRPEEQQEPTFKVPTEPASTPTEPASTPTEPASTPTEPANTPAEPASTPTGSAVSKLMGQLEQQRNELCTLSYHLQQQRRESEQQGRQDLEVFEKLVQQIDALRREREQLKAQQIQQLDAQRRESKERLDTLLQQLATQQREKEWMAHQMNRLMDAVKNFAGLNS